MTDRNAEGRRAGPLNPQALRLEDMARLLSACLPVGAAAGLNAITVEMLQADIDAGAPVNADGTMNLVHYVAWLLKEAGRGD